MRLFSKYIEKTYYITCLQKFLNIKVDNSISNNLNEKIVVDINNYLNSVSINKIIVQNIKKFLNKITGNTISFNIIKQYSTFNDLILKSYKLDKNILFLEFSNSVLEQCKINLKINFL